MLLWRPRGAAPAPPGRRHRGCPLALWCSKAAAAPATLGQTGSHTTHSYIVGHKSRTACLEEAARPAVCQPQVLKAAPLALPASWHGDHPAPRQHLKAAAPAPPARWHWACSKAPQRLREAAAAPPSRHHWGHPTAPQCLKAAAAPGTLGQTGSDTAYGYNGGRKSRTAGLEDAAEQSCTSPKCWPPSPSTIKLAACLICTGRSHVHLSVILLCLSRGAALGDGTGQAVFSPKVGNAFPRPSSPQAGLGRPAAQHLGHVLQALLAPGGCCSASLRRSAFPWWDVPPHPPEPRLHPRSLPLPHSPATALPHLREQLRHPPWRSLPQGGQPCPGCPDWAPAPWHVPGSGGSLPKSS